jgi:hypothetical protein
LSHPDSARQEAMSKGARIARLAISLIGGGKADLRASMSDDPVEGDNLLSGKSGAGEGNRTLV